MQYKWQKLLQYISSVNKLEGGRGAFDKRNPNAYMKDIAFAQRFIKNASQNAIISMLKDLGYSNMVYGDLYLGHYETDQGAHELEYCGSDDFQIIINDYLRQPNNFEKLNEDSIKEQLENARIEICKLNDAAKYIDGRVDELRKENELLKMKLATIQKISRC